MVYKDPRISVLLPIYYQAVVELRNEKNAQTDDVIIPFGSGSAVSCDSTGNYFNLWMNGFQSERYYKFEFKVVSGSGTDEETINYFDDDFLFKVVR